jgi:hypothetical protein
LTLRSALLSGALLRQKLHLLVTLHLVLLHALNLLILRGRCNRAWRHELGKTGQRFENRLTNIRSSADLRQDFLQLLNYKPQPLQTSRLITSIRRRLRCGSLTERRLLLRLGWINGWGWHLLALVFAPTIALDH